MLYDEKIEALISAALADGVLTEKEKQVLFKKAQNQGIDLDEFEMVLDARLVELEKAEKEKAEKSAPKSSKYGDVRKCPVCGAMVPALAGACPECGYEFSGIEANLSSKKLTELLLNEEHIWKKQDIIVTFPIPNTKADLFEFLSSLQPRLQDIHDPLAGAYFKKYEECINKARSSFANDAVFQPYIASFENEKQQLERKYKINAIKSWCSDHLLLLGGIIIGLIIAVSLICKGINKAITNARVEKSVEKIELSMQTGNADEVMKAVQASVDLGQPIELLTKLVDQRYLDAALYCYNHKTSHCAVYETEKKKHVDESEFTKKATTLLYEALIKEERMEEAWEYHLRSRESQTAFWIADEYFDYISDVVNYYCQNGNKDAARKFVKQHLTWFAANVDNDKYNEKNWNEYWTKHCSKNVNKRLMQQINNY